MFDHRGQRMLLSLVILGLDGSHRPSVMIHHWLESWAGVGRILRQVFGRFPRDVARGLRIRCDWGSQLHRQCLVAPDRHDPLHAAVDRRIDHVLGPADVHPHGLDGVVLNGRHRLPRRRVDDKCRCHSWRTRAPFVVHVADEPTHARVSDPEVRPHLLLL